MTAILTRVHGSAIGPARRSLVAALLIALVATASAGPASGAPMDTDPPTVVVGTTDLQSAGGASGAGAVSAAIHWTADDPGDGVASARLGASINGGPIAEYAPVSIGEGNADVVLLPGRRYQFFVEATDGAGNASGWVPGAPFTVMAAQETAAALTYRGPWSRAHPTGAFGHGTMRTFRAGASVTYRFIGRSIVLIAPIGPTRGAAKAYVDGVYWGLISLRTFETLPRQFVFDKSWPTVGTHTVRLVIQARQKPRFDVDAFVVLR